MPLDTPSKRRSAVASLGVWELAPPSPTDSPGVIDQADSQHIAGTYSGILAVELVEALGTERWYWGQAYFGSKYFGGAYWGGTSSSTDTATLGWLKPELAAFGTPKRPQHPYTYAHQTGQLGWISIAIDLDQKTYGASRERPQFEPYPLYMGARLKPHYLEYPGNNAANLTARETTTIAVAGWRRDTLTMGLPPPTGRGVIQTPIDFGWISRIQPPLAELDPQLWPALMPEKGGYPTAPRSKHAYTLMEWSAQQGWIWPTVVLPVILAATAALTQQRVAEYPVPSRKLSPLITFWGANQGWVTAAQIQPDNVTVWPGIEAALLRNFMPQRHATAPYPPLDTPLNAWMQAAIGDTGTLATGVFAMQYAQPMPLEAPWPYATVSHETGQLAIAFFPAIDALVPLIAPALAQMLSIYLPTRNNAFGDPVSGLIGPVILLPPQPLGPIVDFTIILGNLPREG